MPGVQRDAGAWDKFDEGTDSDDSSDSRVVRVYRGDTSDDEATPDKYCWLDDEREDLGKVASVPARLDRIGWNDDAFRAAKGGSICRLPPKSPPVFFVRERKYLFSSHFFPKRDDDCTLVRHFFSLILLHPSFVRLGRKREKRHNLKESLKPKP